MSVKGFNFDGTVQKYDYDHLDNKIEKTTLAPEFTPGKAYSAGDMVFYEGKLYSRKTDGTDQSWILSNWTETDIEERLTAVEEDVSDLKGDLDEAVASLHSVEQGIVVMESGAFKVDNITKGPDETRIRNVSPIGALKIYSITIPDGYDCYLRYYDSSMMFLASKTWFTGELNSSAFENGTAYISTVFRKQGAVTSDITAYVETVQNGFIIKTLIDNDIELLKNRTTAVEDDLDELVSYDIPDIAKRSSDKFVLSFELGGMNTNTGTEGDAINRARSGYFYAPVKLRIASLNDEFKFRVIKFSADKTTCYGAMQNSNVNEYTVDEGFSYRILIFPATLSDLTNHINEIDAAIYCFKNKRVFTVSKDGNGDFDDVQLCLDYLPKTGDDTYTIVIYPGTYDKICTLTTKKYVDSPVNEGVNNSWRRRRLNLIGISPTNCIIKSDTGEYMTPAAEISIIGEIRNLCFISTHTSPPADREEDDRYLNHKAYAVHSDYDTSDELYTNCIGISYQAPAWGIGGAQNKKIRLVNCRAYNYSDANGEYSVMKDYGGIYYHLANGANKTGQVFELKDCYAYDQNGNKALWIQIPSGASNWSQETHLYHNIFWGDECLSTVVIGASLLSADSYGNNAPNANAG